MIQTEWDLNHQVFNQICYRLQPMVDLFATKLNHKVPMYGSPVPYSQSWKTGAFCISWDGLDSYLLSISLDPAVVQNDYHLQAQNCHD